MSLFGSLFTGVSALAAQSQNTAIISNNIANVNTIGFKRSEASFESLVTTEGRSSRFSPGTVAVNRIQRVDQQGPIQQSISSTDVSVSGNGFFPVKRNGDDSSLDEYLYTRNGQFSEDAQGNLRNSVGFFLYGWPLDSEGNLPAAQGDLSSLVPVDVAFLGGLTRPTNNAELSINLDADQVDYDTLTFTPAIGLPVPDEQPAHFSRGLRVFDTLGSGQDLTFEYRKIVGPMAHATSGAAAMELDYEFVNGTSTSSIAAGDAFTIDIPVSAAGPAVNQTYTFVDTAPAVATEVQTVQELINAINADFGGRLELRLSDDGRLVFQASDLRDTIQLSEPGPGTPLTGASSLSIINDPISAGTPLEFPPEVITTAYPDQTNDFPVFAEANTPNTQGWWQLTILDGAGTELSEGLINFNGDGSINAVPDTDGNIDIELSNINWGNGSELQDINVDIERFSQFAGEYNVIFSDQDGAELGLRTGVEIDRDGFVIARFSNGASTELYQIPMVTFANPNGLQEISGTAYTENDLSGEENLREAGSGGAGLLETATLENSNVDLADEFARLIISQRAYSAGTKVINTVDQMTEELLRLR